MFKVQLHIDGAWRDSRSGRSIAVFNPATEEHIGDVAHADVEDLALAAASAEKGFRIWRKVSPLERSGILRKAADLLRQRVDAIATAMTLEQGKPRAEARIEILLSADFLDWFAEEGRRTYGRIVPARAQGVTNLVLKEPVGPVLALTPWNFPISQVTRKVGAALCAGCSVVVKPPEETPASAAELIRALVDAGLPAGVVNLVYGVPAEVSEYLISHPAIRKISFTGSTQVGKLLASMAGAHMKRVTMELGGHAPAIVFDDADISTAATVLAGAKFRNAGQVCISPTRFLIQENAYDRFMEEFVARARSLKLGNGLDADTTMGPLANDRRQIAVGALIDDAVKHGAKIVTGGGRVQNKGHFFEPTILADVPLSARAMTEEPFGPVALVNRFKDFDEVMAEANRLPYGLAAYAFSRSARTVNELGNTIESGMISINHQGLGGPELPFGGMKDSGYGSEGGIEAVEAYLTTKLVSQMNAAN